MCMEKICNKCQLKKGVSQFNKKRDTKDGLTSICKECKKASRNKERDRETYKIWSQKNREYLNTRMKIYRDKNKKHKPKKTIDEIKAHKKEYNREYIKKKRLNDPIYRLRVNIKRNIISSLKRKNFKKDTKTQEILGCSFEDFKQHIESQWETWMNWENYGKYNGTPNHGWDIDHTIPSSSANTKEDVLKLNHYTNLKPLCSYINRKIKQNKKI